METLKKIDLKQLFVALATFGIVSSSEPQAAIMGLVAMAVVFVVNTISKMQGKPMSRAWVTLIVYGVAFGMALAAQPYPISWPVWTGDPALFTAQLAVLLAEIGPIALAVTGSATLIYNSLQRLVFEKLEDHLLGTRG